jgi:tetratricopeptide (TPR) repeat protein
MRFPARAKLYVAPASLFLGFASLQAQTGSYNETAASGRTIDPEIGLSAPAEPSTATSISTQPHTLSTLASQLQPVIDVLTNVLNQYRRSGNRDGEANTLCALGNSYNSLGQQQKAIDQFQLALAVYRDTADMKGQANALSHIGSIYRNWGFPEMSIRFYRDSLLAYAKTEDKLGKAIAMNNLGVTYLQLSNKKKALDYLNQAREGYSDAGDHHAEALALINIGATENFLAHDPQKSLEFLQEAVTKLEALNDLPNEADAFELMGVVYASMHKLDTAESNFLRSLTLYREAQNSKGEASVLKHIKSLHDLDVASIR